MSVYGGGYFHLIQYIISLYFFQLNLHGILVFSRAPTHLSLLANLCGKYWIMLKKNQTLQYSFN